MMLSVVVAFVQEPKDAVVRNGLHGCFSVAVVCAVQDGSRGPGTQTNLQHHQQTDKTHRCIFFSPEAGDKRDKRPSRGQEGQGTKSGRGPINRDRLLSPR